MPFRAGDLLMRCATSQRTIAEQLLSPFFSTADTRRGERTVDGSLADLAAIRAVINQSMEHHLAPVALGGKPSPVAAMERRPTGRSSGNEPQTSSISARLPISRRSPRRCGARESTMWRSMSCCSRMRVRSCRASCSSFPKACATRASSSSTSRSDRACRDPGRDRAAVDLHDAKPCSVRARQQAAAAAVTATDGRASRHGRRGRRLSS